MRRSRRTATTGGETDEDDAEEVRSSSQCGHLPRRPSLPRWTGRGVWRRSSLSAAKLGTRGRGAPWRRSSLSRRRRRGGAARQGRAPLDQLRLLQARDDSDEVQVAELPLATTTRGKGAKLLGATASGHVVGPRGASSIPLDLKESAADAIFQGPMALPAARQKNASVTGGGGLRPSLVESDVQRNQFLTVCRKRISAFDNLAFRWPIVSIPKKLIILFCC
jgi:hypothetical protein